MQKISADIVIIGGGASGLSTAYYLSKQGCRNIYIIEQDKYLGGQSTSRCAGGFRHQFSSKINIELSKLSNELFEKMIKKNDTIFNRCGYAFILTEEVTLDSFREAVSLQNTLGVDTKWLSKEDVKKLIPEMNTAGVLAATHCAQDGLIDVGYIISNYIEELKRQNIQIITGSKVLSIDVDSNGNKYVKTENARIKAPILVNAAGAYSANINRMLQLELPVKPMRQQLLTTTKVSWDTRRIPVVIFPSTGLGFHMEGEGLLSGLHKEEFDKNDITLLVNREWEISNCKSLVNYLEGVENSHIASRWAGLYDMTSDLNPILGEDNDMKGIYYITGFSGHGFMHSPASGYLLSQLILKKQLSLDISELNIGRFERKNTLSKEMYKI